MTCNNCERFVEETKTPGNYQHSEAVKKQNGFCLMQDLFTMVNPTDETCSDFQFDGIEEEFELSEMFEK